MDSEELYQLKSDFYQANYKTVLAHPLPSPSSASYLPTLIYQLRSHLALTPSSPLPPSPTGAGESIALRAVTSFSNYLRATEKAEALEELRELVLEVEGEEELGWEEGVVRVLAGTAFFREGEVEEALDTLSGESAKRDLECVALTAQIQLSLNRPDLAQKTLEAAKKWADDALLLQLVEAWVALRSIPPNYTSAYYTFLELTTVPSPSAPMLVNRAISQLCQGNYPEAEGSLSEALEKDGECVEGLVLKARGGGEAALKKVQGLGWGVAEREAEAEKRFEEAKGRWEVPPLATASA